MADATLLTGIFTIAGTVVGALVTYRIAVLQQRSSQVIAEHQARTQVALSAEEHRHTLEVARRNELLNSYNTLSQWLFEVDSTIAKIHELLWDSAPSSESQARELLEDFPYKTLRYDGDTFRASTFWSSEVAERLGKVRGRCAPMVSAGWRAVARDDATGAYRFNDVERGAGRNDFWGLWQVAGDGTGDERLSVGAAIGEVKRQMRSELAGFPDS